MDNFKNQIKKAVQINKMCLKKFKEARITKHIRLRIDLYEAVKKIAKAQKSTISKILDELVENALCRVQE
ncbi:MAG: hypothetical protein UV68_C0041G0002 [Candidatus Collierbacteria bacterium GW2011_GWC2_43_12]|uniref:Uncharacterized protein n=1 Tax=Candidatus Collierbacteria bacterium GW2011_GWC2_43_12 TaxID=1618390 RepID=A0A0G1D419_9BACT|nr:MAG: hypothetical protein UV68_C0041G0002 [Candidatus Collierbacteria bacterium GW2011_GWC2_43_12]